VTLLKRLFGAKPDVPPSIAEACADLDRLGRDQPALHGHARALRAAVILFAHPVRESAWTMPIDRIKEKWIAGVPLLRSEKPPLDAKAFAQRWFEFCDVLVRHENLDAALELARALRNRRLLPAAMMTWILSGQVSEFHAHVEAKGLDAALAASILRWTLFPWLVHLQTSLVPSLPSTPWPHGYCPICGSWPALGEFRGLEQVRFLRCGLCAASWEFPRLCCPFCGVDDHRQLGYLHREGDEGKERIATCDACRGYIKIVNTLTPLKPEQLLVMELATLPLDLVAGDRGYFVP